MKVGQNFCFIQNTHIKKALTYAVLFFSQLYFLLIIRKRQLKCAGIQACRILVYRAY